MGEVFDALLRRKQGVGRAEVLFCFFKRCGPSSEAAYVAACVQTQVTFTLTSPPRLHSNNPTLGHIFLPLKCQHSSNFISVSCTIHAVLSCSAGGREEEEDADEIWIISSQCLAKPHSAGTTAFSMQLPSHSASQLQVQHLATNPPLAFNQPKSHTNVSIHLPPMMKRPPLLCIGCCLALSVKRKC